MNCPVCQQGKIKILIYYSNQEQKHPLVCEKCYLIFESYNDNQLKVNENLSHLIKEIAKNTNLDLIKEIQNLPLYSSQ